VKTLFGANILGLYVIRAELTLVPAAIFCDVCRQVKLFNSATSCIA